MEENKLNKLLKVYGVNYLEILSEVSKLEEENARLVRALREQNQIRQEIAHDSKGPFVGVDGYSHILLKMIKDAENEIAPLDMQKVKTLLKKHYLCSIQLKNSVGLYNLGEISHTELLKFRKESNPYRILKDNIEANFASLDNGKGVTAFYSTNLENEKFWTAPETLSSVIGNVCGNALKYSASDSQIFARASISNLEGRVLNFEMENRTEKQLTQEQLERIFEEGYRVNEGEINRSGSDIGLGLYMASKFVKKAFLGKIHVCSDYQTRIEKKENEKEIHVGGDMKFGEVVGLPLFYIKISIPEFNCPNIGANPSY